MKLIIDIPEERYKDIKRIASVQLEMRADTAEQIIAGTPFDSVIEDIKAEILCLRDDLEAKGYMNEIHALNFALEIIDKHISGKEHE